MFYIVKTKTKTITFTDRAQAIRTRAENLGATLQEVSNYRYNLMAARRAGA